MTLRLLLALCLVASACAKKTEDAGAGDGAAPNTAEATQDGDARKDAEKKAHDAAAKIPGTAPKGEFGVKSAKITFKLTGVEQGTEEVWVEGYGSTVYVKRTIEKPMKSVTTLIWKDGKQTTWDEESKRVQIMKLRSKATELRLVSTNDPKQFGYAGYEKKPNETVAGKECEVWHSPKQNVTLWRWKGIDIKYQNGSLGKVTQASEATSVEEGVTLPAELLKHPDGYEVRDFTKPRKK